MEDRAAQLAQAWTDAARGYEEYFVPRFAPWVELAVNALGADLPDGPILVPCCGTFPELPLLGAAYPGRAIVGVDLSPGMVALAADRAASWPQAQAIVGDACAVGPEWTGRCAAVLSVFGLQQLPDPAAALASWAGLLRPGGRLSVVFWPEIVEDDGPFALSRRALDRPAPLGDDEGRLAEAITAAGAVVTADREVSFVMEHPDAATVWAAMVDSGPLRAVALSSGEAVLAEAGRRFLAAAPSDRPWRHTPRARLLTAIFPPKPSQPPA
ncbi:MAG: class I SAM-dependent methyltransferase [Hamadaea sp.]|nr:class I SAM-dependent methyltransferase [Hamadaea sp.]